MSARGIYLKVQDFQGRKEGVAELSATTYHYLHLPSRGYLIIIGRDHRSAHCKAICGGTLVGTIGLSRSNQKILDVSVGDYVHVATSCFQLFSGKDINVWKADPLLRRLPNGPDMHLKMNITRDSRLFDLQSTEGKQVTLDKRWFHPSVTIPPLPSLNNSISMNESIFSSNPPAESANTMWVKVRKLNGKRVKVKVSDKPVSDILFRVFRFSSQEVRLYYGNLELDPDLSLSSQGVPNRAKICAKKSIMLHCRTSNGFVNLIATGRDSIAKVKMNFVLAAELDCNKQYELLLRGTALFENYTVKHFALNEHSELHLRKIVVKEEISIIIPDTPILPPQKPRILDPITFMKMLLTRGKVCESEEESSSGDHMIKIVFEIINLGSLRMTIDDRQTVLEAKQKLAKEIKANESDQRMIFNGDLMQDSDTFESFGFMDGDIVNVTCTGNSSHLFLSLEYFDPAGDRDYTNYIPPSAIKKRGGYDYFPPVGWKRFGLKVTGKFENDIWLGNSNQPGEWIVSYHGAGLSIMQGVARTGYNIEVQSNAIYSQGVVTAPHVEDAESAAISFTWEGQDYKIVFMNRINPNTVEEMSYQRPNKIDRYLTKSDGDVRPYGLLIKEVKSSQALQADS